jgi:hypothetical protein
VTIDQQTHYPFDEQIAFAVQTSKPVAFPLYLRVPGWCDDAVLAINGAAARIDAKPKQYIRIDRMWSDGDTVTLSLPMEVRVHCWEKNHRCVSVERGPLTYSLKIGERYVCVEDRGGWDAFEIHPTTPWNYGLVIDSRSPARSFQVKKKDWPADDMPFTQAGTPIEIEATGRRIPEWQLDEFGLVSELQDSPVRSDQPDEPITLIPMGAARLRISALPVIGDGPDANTWSSPPEPIYRASASHCFSSDTVRAVADERLPSSSDDHSIPRMTWWPNKGGAEWIQADFGEPKSVSSVAVYWFDDTGRGQCRVPASWRVLYRDGDQWKPVETNDSYPVAKDRLNRLRFAPVATTALRLEVQLQENFSGGILEWQIE